MASNRPGRRRAGPRGGGNAAANPPPSPRAQALDVCLKVLQGQSLSDCLEPVLQRLSDDRDRAFCSELCHGFCRQYFALHKHLDQRLDKPLKNRDSDVRVILLLGLYQLIHTRVENHAAVNESVKLLQRRGKGWARGLVNAILRGFLRDREAGSLMTPEPADSYPQWMQQRLRDDWPERADELFLAGDQRAPMTLRVDQRRQICEQALEQLAEAGIEASEHPVVDSALVLDRPHPVAGLPGFGEGLLSVQDAAAQLAAPLLDCATGDRVLDACAAPGGKTLHLLQRQPDIELLALDKDAQRLQRVAENLERAGLKADLVAADAADTGRWHDGRPFDRILLDAPCSASGILRRHPDIKLLRKSPDIPALAAQQRRLLLALWPLLKPGGRLLYATCSIFREENERQIEAFVADHGDCVEGTPNTVQWGEQRPFGRQILTGDQAMDGFYYAVLEKAPS